MSAKTIWSDLEAEGFAAAERWVSEPKQDETSYLEFKTTTAKDGVPSRGDRSQAARTISAFGNVDGGVLVFGVQTKSRSANPDAADSLVPVADAQAFATKLASVARDLTTPHVPGPQVRAFLKAGSSEGIVAVYVPPTDVGPFRATGDIEDRFKDKYFLRTSRGTDVMPHQILAAMFGRAPSPELHLRLSVGAQSDSALVRYAAMFDVVNVGRGTARTPSVRFFLKHVLSDRCVELSMINSEWASVPCRVTQDDVPKESRRYVQSAVIYPDDALYLRSADLAPGEYDGAIRIDAEAAYPTEWRGRIRIERQGDVFWLPALTGEPVPSDVPVGSRVRPRTGGAREFKTVELPVDGRVHVISIPRLGDSSEMCKFRLDELQFVDGEEG